MARAPRLVRTDRATLAAFLATVILAGLNFVAVRFSNRELPPFEGAALRFGAAAALFFAFTRVRAISLPRGRGLIGAVLFGALAFFASYALAYWGLVAAPAGLGSLSFALVPLFTSVLAVAHGLEPLRPRSLVGGAAAAIGIAIVFAEQLAATVPIAALVALLASAATAAESSVVVKYFPRSHPAATNAVAMAVGTLALVTLSLMAGEHWIIPASTTTALAYAYLVVSTIALFALALYVLGRWTVSAASFQFPLSPLVTVAVAALLAGETVSLRFLAGGALVIAGVIFAATGRLRTRAPAPSFRPA